MGATGIIFQREFNAYLRLPIGYIVGAVVLFLDGIMFWGIALRPDQGELLSGDVLSVFFYLASGMTTIAAVVLSLRLIAEERQTGTQLLLDTSPVRDREIVLGKFLAALAFLSILNAATIYMPMLILVNGKISIGQIVAGYMGLTLLGGAVLAIGLFGSALSRNQLVAAAVTSVITGMFYLFWQLSAAVEYPLSRFFAALAIHQRHFIGFQQGIFHLRDIVYYLSLTWFFLYLATRVMEAKRWE